MAESMRWKVAVGDVQTSVEYDAPSGGAGTVFICGHGAGGNMNDRSVLAVARELVRRDIAIVRFNFLYKENRSGRPDPMPLLKACYAAVIQHVRRELQPQRLLLGGRSMGGRVASMLCADGEPCDALLLLAYPLHPDGKPQQLRDAHLPAIRVPVLCFNGTRDTMCTPELMQGALTKVTTPWTMHWLDGADHSFHVLKRSGRTDADVLTEVGATTAGWLARLATKQTALG